MPEIPGILRLTNAAGIFLLNRRRSLLAHFSIGGHHEVLSAYRERLGYAEGKGTADEGPFPSARLGRFSSRVKGRRPLPSETWSNLWRIAGRHSKI